MVRATLTVEKKSENSESLVFSPHDLKQLNYVNSVSLDGDELASDQAEIVIRQSGDSWRDDWNGVRRDCSALISNIADAGRNEKYFYKDLVRTGKNEFVLTVQSPIGRLLSKHPGGLYDGSQNLPTVIADVIGHAIRYNPVLDSVNVYGWAPYQPRRKTLQDLMFAYGFIIRRDSENELYFTVPGSDSGEIPRNAIYIGGSVDYRTGNGYARADVTAKELFVDSDADEKTLFDNVAGGVAAVNRLVTFDSPAHSLSTTGGLAIQDSGANYAVVSGLGTLTGKPYSILESVVSVDGDNDADPENVLNVSNAAFITTLNAAAVAERLLNVRRAVVVSANIRRTAQRAGDLVSFEDPFGDRRTGYIVSLRGNVTSVDKAAAKIVCGYAPVWGNDYDAVIVLTPDDEAVSDEWLVPPALNGKTLRVVLIGGGTGGASGQRGSDDTANGGGKGAPGGGGRILEIRLSVRGGDRYVYHCGSGGAGGVPSTDYDVDENRKKTYRNNAGSAGDATTFGEYSSETGAYSGAGFYDMIGDNRYAAPGPDNGVDGGEAATGTENGSRSNPAYETVTPVSVTLPLDDYQNWTYDGQIYDNVEWTSGGAGNGEHYHQEDYDPDDEFDDEFDEWAYGGLGGGAAVGNDGGDGFDASTGDCGGNGGDGADALPIFPEDTRAYGSGGSGGHGGGAGGKGGSGNTTAKVYPSLEPVIGTDGATGTGGSGSPGQNGKAGCVLIYYKRTTDEASNAAHQDS